MTSNNDNNTPAKHPSAVGTLMEGLWVTIDTDDYTTLLRIAMETYRAKGFDDPPGDEDLYHAEVEQACRTSGGYANDHEEEHHANMAIRGCLDRAGAALRSLNRTQLALIIADIRLRIRDIAMETDMEASQMKEFNPAA